MIIFKFLKNNIKKQSNSPYTRGDYKNLIWKPDDPIEKSDIQTDYMLFRFSDHIQIDIKYFFNEFLIVNFEYWSDLEIWNLNRYGLKNQISKIFRSKPDHIFAETIREHLYPPTITNHNNHHYKPIPFSQQQKVVAKA